MHLKNKAFVISNMQLATSAYLLRFRRSFDFIAGQVIGIGMGNKDEARLYSIASGEESDTIDILYTVNPSGLLTPALSALHPGDSLHHTDPFGHFICREERAVWIAAGTGIAPFAAMAFSGQSPGKQLIFGNRKPDRLYFHDRLKSLFGDRYTACCSGGVFQGTFKGRVTDYLNSLAGLDLNIPYYLCGSAEMVVDVRDILIMRGLAYDQIYAEIFF